MTVTRNTGSDLLPFAPRPTYPGARLRAMRDARARREREAPPPDEAYTAERLRRDLASLPREVVLQDRTNGNDEATRDHLRRAGWTNARLAAAQTELHQSLTRRVFPPPDPALTAAGGAGRGRLAYPIASRTPAAVSQRVRDLRGERLNVAQARAMGLVDQVDLLSAQGHDSVVRLMNLESAQRFYDHLILLPVPAGKGMPRALR